jgi:Glycosyl transferases group 1
VILLIGGNHVIVPRTLAILKERLGTTLVYATGTSPIVFAVSIERAAARLYDLVVTNDAHHAAQWRELGAPRAEALPLSAVDPAFHHTLPLTDTERAASAAEVAFVGTLVPGALYGDRVKALEALTEFDLAIWSIHEVPASLRRFHRGGLLGEAMLRALSAAAVTVNPHGDFMRHGGNLRLFELCGIGAFQLTDDRPGTRQWFTPGEHLDVYRDPADLRRLVRHYLAHPEERRRIAAAGQSHVHRHHTYDERMGRLAGLIAEIRVGRT